MQFKMEIIFTTFTEMDDFVTNYRKVINKDAIKAMKTIEKRGCKTSELHKKAKEFKILHPEMTYRECFISIAENKIDDSETKDEEPIVIQEIFTSTPPKIIEPKIIEPIITEPIKVISDTQKVIEEIIIIKKPRKNKKSLIQ